MTPQASRLSFSSDAVQIFHLQIHLLSTHIKNQARQRKFSNYKKSFSISKFCLSLFFFSGKTQQMFGIQLKDWPLKIKYVQLRDAGLYECVVSIIWKWFQFQLDANRNSINFAGDKTSSNFYFYSSERCWWVFFGALIVEIKFYFKLWNPQNTNKVKFDLILMICVLWECKQIFFVSSENTLKLNCS